MAKKTHRPNIPETTLERARRQMQREAAVAPTPETTASSEAAAPKPRPAARLSSADLRQEYEYVVTDLQSMGILAAIFLGALVALSFFL